MHDMDFGVSLWYPSSCVHMMPSEVSTKGNSLINREIGEILVAKDKDLTLGSKKRKLVFCFVRKRGELDSGDLSASCGRELLSSHSWVEEIFQGRIGVFAGVMVCEGLQRGKVV
jgi:hypothetical protein